jgi:hypothetical protein
MPDRYLTKIRPDLVIRYGLADIFVWIEIWLGCVVHVQRLDLEPSLRS